VIINQVKQKLHLVGYLLIRYPNFYQHYEKYNKFTDIPFGPNSAHMRYTFNKYSHSQWLKMYRQQQHNNLHYAHKDANKIMSK